MSWRLTSWTWCSLAVMLGVILVSGTLTPQEAHASEAVGLIHQPRLDLQAPLQAAGIDPAAGPDVPAKAAAIIDMQTGALLYARNPHEHLPMASTTKIMTAIVAIEHVPDLSTPMTVPEAATKVPSGIFLRAGDTYTFSDMLYALLLNSANDAAVTIAYNVGGGSVDRFVQMMNNKAQQLGLTDTHYSDPSGLDHPGHYTSAGDLARLARYAMQNPTFRKYVGTYHATIPYPVKHSRRQLYNHNHLLTSFAGATGVKTGFTQEAGFCLVGSARDKSGREVIAVVLHTTKAQLYPSISKLLNYGLDDFQVVTLSSPGQVVKVDNQPALPAASVQLLVPKPQLKQLQVSAVTDALSQSTQASALAAGKLVASVKGQVISSVPLLKRPQAVQPPAAAKANTAGEKQAQGSKKSGWGWSLFEWLFVLVVMLAAGWEFRRYRRRVNEARRRLRDRRPAQQRKYRESPGE